mgnify:CR=1 FL=1
MIGIRTISGLPDLREALQGIVPKLRYRALRNALAAGARVVRDAARAATPVLAPGSVAMRKGYRKPGTVKRAISVRTSKIARRSGDVGVFVNVKPAKSANRGARNPNDPFYWRFIEFGTKRGVRPYRFLQAGVARLDQALAVFIKTIGPQIQKLNTPKAPPP